MRNESREQHTFGSWTRVFIAGSVVCGLCGCAEGAEVGWDIDEEAFEAEGVWELEDVRDESPEPVAALASPPADNAFPVAGYVLPESCEPGFGDPRSGGRTHQGLDCFAHETHAPLVAVENATIRRVKSAAESASYSGNSISIRGDSGWRYYYGHIHYTPFTSADEHVTRVQKGDVIALMGSSGTAKEHLHFETAPGNDSAVDPYPFMGTWRRTAGGDPPTASPPAEPTPPPPPPGGCGVLAPGQALAPGEILYSCDGRFQVQLQTDGNVVLRVVDYVALWSSQTHGSSPSALVMQEDGNLVLYGTNGAALWHISTHGNPGAHMTLQDDGNLVVYHGDRALWNTGPA